MKCLARIGDISQRQVSSERRAFPRCKSREHRATDGAGAEEGNACRGFRRAVTHSKDVIGR
jgi:hypothetical protein